MSVFGDATPEQEQRISPWESRFPVLYALRDPVVRRSLLVLGLAAVVVLFLVFRGGSDRRSFTFGPSAKSPDLGAGVVSGLASTPGHVSPTLAREAERIAASDATLARLVRWGNGRQLGDPSPWFLGNDQKGGAILEYKLRRPIQVDSAVPFVAIPPDAPSHGTCVSPYAPGWAHLRASDVTRLSASVDLRKGRVVDIGTNARSGTISPVAGKPYPTCNENQPG